jgi:hypothetical protein
LDGVAADSFLRVELLDYAERLIRRYSGERATMIKTSGLRVPVSGSDSEQVTGVSGTVKIKIAFDGSLR